MFCHKCGAKARDNQDFCMRCGAKLLKRTTKNSSSTDSAISGERTSKVQTPSLWVESAEPLAVQWASTESVRPDNISSKKKIITIIIAAVVGIAMLIAGWHVLSDSGKIAELGWIKTSNNNNGNPDSDSANRDPLTAKVVSECDGVRDAAAADFADDGDHLRVALSMDDFGTMQTVRLLGCIASQAGIGSSDGSSFSQQSFQDGTQLMSELFGLAASDPSKYVYSSDEAKSAVSKMEYQSVDGDLDARCVYDANNSMLYCHMKSSSTDSSEE